MDDCVFCKIAKGEIPCYKVWEDEEFIAFLDANPRCEGHALVIPKKHFITFMDLDEDTSCKYLNAVREVGEILMEKYNAPAFNIFLNNGKEAGQAVWHAHFHLLPRKEGEKEGIFID